MQDQTTKPTTAPPLAAPDDRIGAQILAIVAKEAEIDPALLTPEATIAELGIPSLDMTMAIFALEKHFDIEIPVVAEQTGGEFETVGALVAHVRATIAKTHPNFGSAA